MISLIVDVPSRRSLTSVRAERSEAGKSFSLPRGAADGVYPGHATREMRTGCGRNSNKIDMGMGYMINKERCKMSEEKKHDYKAIISNDDH